MCLTRTLVLSNLFTLGERQWRIGQSVGRAFARLYGGHFFLRYSFAEPAIGNGRKATVVTLFLMLAGPLYGQSNPAGNPAPDYSVRINVPVVTLDVAVQNQDGIFIPGLNKENFRILEDGVPQTITSFGSRQNHINIVLLVEFSAGGPGLEENALVAAQGFIGVMKDDDWTALILFDRKPRIAQDFTQDKQALYASLREARVPLSREINLFDSLDDTLTRMESVEGPKYIILIASGQDTFSGRTLDQTLDKIKLEKDTIIYSIDTGRGLGHRQADNQMGVFARLSGGMMFYASSIQDYADVFRDIAQSIRSRYSMSYHSSHKAQDGAWHKIQVEVTPPAGVRARYQVTAREGYRAKLPLEVHAVGHK